VELLREETNLFTGRMGEAHSARHRKGEGRGVRKRHLRLEKAKGGHGGNFPSRTS